MNSDTEKVIQILNLEDSARDAEIIAEKLNEEGLFSRVKRVESRKEFIGAIEHNEWGQWDIILADYSLPSFDGLSALKIARQKCPDVPFIIVSGALGEEVAVEALKSGATDYILKDRLARLPLAVRRALEERAASQERKRSEALLSLRTKALESTANGIVITDREGTIIWANAACTALTGYTSSEILGKNPRILKSDQHDEAFYRNLWATILEGEVWRSEIINRRKDGTLYTEEMTITPVRDTQGAITSFVAVKQDVTARKDLEEQLSQARKMEAIGLLAGGIAHDFNNLLTVITGYSDMLLEDTGISPAQCAKEISKAGDRAAELTRQLLMFSRRQVLQPRVLNLNHVVSNIAGMLRRLIGEHLELVVVSGDTLGSVKADPGQIEQIIMNLAVNAREAMPQGGRLTIETANMSFEKAVRKGRFQIPPGPYVMLSISDNGHGMTEEVRTHIFEPFFTTKDKSKGSGLGLSTVYGVVKQSGGFITAESEPGEGSIFSVYLPCIEEQPQAVRPVANEQRGSKKSGVVLLVEDELGVRKLTRSILESGGYTVLEYGDPAEALRRFGQSPPSPIDLIDLLLTDVVMPQISGIVLAERLVRFHEKMKVIYMSGYSEELLQQQGIHSAAFVPKPFTPAGLLSKVREVLDSQTVKQRRQHDRADCPNVDVECAWGEHRTKARGVNLSEGGILLASLERPIPVHERVFLNLKAAASECCGGLHGSVMRTPALDRVAVKFEDLSSSERATLNQLVSSMLGTDPSA